jgi:hypothetical protein
MCWDEDSWRARSGVRNIVAITSNTVGEWFQGLLPALPSGVDRSGNGTAEMELLWDTWKLAIQQFGSTSRDINKPGIGERFGTGLRWKGREWRSSRKEGTWGAYS